MMFVQHNSDFSGNTNICYPSDKSALAWAELGSWVSEPTWHFHSPPPAKPYLSQSFTTTSAPPQPPPFTTTSGDNPHRRAPFSSSSPLLTSVEPRNYSASSSSPPKPRAAVATFSILGSPLVCHQTAATTNLLRSVLTAFQPVTTPLHTNEPATFSSLSHTGRTAAPSTSHSDTDDEPLSPFLLPSLSSRLTIANQPSTVAIPTPFPVLPWNDQNRVQPMATFSILGSPLVCHQTAATTNLLRSVLTAFQPVTTPLHTNEPATFSSLSHTGRTAAPSTSHSDTDDEPLSPFLLPSLSSRLTIANQPSTVAIPTPFPVLPWNDQNRVQPMCLPSPPFSPVSWLGSLSAAAIEAVPLPGRCFCPSQFSHHLPFTCSLSASQVPIFIC
nr:mucin-2-like [Arachis hypogaea]